MALSIKTNKILRHPRCENGYFPNNIDMGNNIEMSVQAHPGIYCTNYPHPLPYLKEYTGVEIAFFDKVTHKQINIYNDSRFATLLNTDWAKNWSSCGLFGGWMTHKQLDDIVRDLRNLNLSFTDKLALDN